ncbi:MAG: SprB repeat-containing protein [Flavobacteriaceae bacterium]
MKNNFTSILMCLFCLFSLDTSAQTQFWSDTFEDTSAPSSGTRTASLEQGGPAIPYGYYFFRTDGSNIDLQPPFAPETATSYQNVQGSKFWAGEDIDKVGTGVNNVNDKVQDITWTGINISGKSGLSFKGFFAANNSVDWQNITFGQYYDFMEVEYRVDGGSWILAGGIYPDVSNNLAGRLREDTNGDKIGDGAILLSRTFQEFGWNIPATGTILDLRFRVSADASAVQEFAIDNFRLFEMPSCTSPTITGNPPNRTICTGSNTTFAISATGATAYQWQVNTGSGFTDISNGGVYSNATTNILTITGATSGMNGYTYRCKAINGVATCFETSNIATLNISNITLSGSQNNISCFGGSNGSATVTATGGTAGYAYSWAPTGGTAATATGLTAGTYTVTVTDANSCTATQSFTITEPTTLTATPSAQTNVSCNGGANGSATVAVTGGTPGYTYSGHPLGTAATATGLTAGTYTVTVTDANSCTATQSFTITEPTALTATPSAQTNVSCNGGANGSATVAVTGAPGYTYSWAPTGGTAATATGLTAGTYTVMVTDANSCTATQSFTITEPTTLTATPSAQTNISCNGGANGSATVAVTGGAPGYTYSWAPTGGTAATATGLTAGTYTVTVTDANSCTATQSFTITEPTTLTATPSAQTNVSCNGGANGSATVAVTGGTPGYTYSWAPTGGTAATATGLTAGTYTVMVTDANSCTATQSFTITEPTALTATPSAQTNVSCNGGANGSATVAVTGDTRVYLFLGTHWGTAATATGLTAGTYTVTVTDANSCTATQSFTITEPTALTATPSAQTNVSCNGGANGSATVAVTGGHQGIPIPGHPLGNSRNGHRTHRRDLYRNGYRCQFMYGHTELYHHGADHLDSHSSAQTNISCNGGANGSATVAVTGAPGYTYSWAPTGEQPQRPPDSPPGPIP